ncbi:MAG: hypothetical protein K0R44_3084 [Thermomicrobiales bacterium]|jgi:hypothetical protein|nr:hypothetical protein [Thermomicrobiales bacterium]
MTIPGSDAVVLGRITTSAARWADESPDNVRESLRGMINAQAQHRGLAALIVRMHPDTWSVIGRWLITEDVSVVCNVDHDSKSITLSTKSLPADVACRPL